MPRSGTSGLAGLLVAIALVTGAAAKPDRPRGALLVKSLAQTALNAWADGGVGDSGAPAGIEWNSPLGVAMLQLMRVLVSPLMHVAAEMTETLLPAGQLVRNGVVHARGGVATATFNVSGLKVTGLRSLSSLKLTPAGPRRVTASASFGFVNASLLLEALLTPFSLPVAAVATAGRFSSSLERFQLDVTFTVPPISRRVALQALALSPPSPEAETRLPAPRLPGKHAAAPSGVKDRDMAEECQTDEAGSPHPVSRAKRQQLQGEASAMVAPLKLGVEEVVVTIHRVSAAVFRPDDDMTKPTLLCATCQARPVLAFFHAGICPCHANLLCQPFPTLAMLMPALFMAAYALARPTLAIPAYASPCPARSCQPHCRADRCHASLCQL